MITTNGYPWPIVLGSDNGSVIAHNTFPDGSCFWSDRCGTVRVYGGNAGTASRDTVVRDNVVGALDVSGSGIAEDHNLVATGTAPGSADIKGSPTFQGGSSPTTYNGFLLTSTSPGKANASDGTDRGISGPEAPLPPAACPRRRPPRRAAPTITAGPVGLDHRRRAPRSRSLRPIRQRRDLHAARIDGGRVRVVHLAQEPTARWRPAATRSP